MKLRRKNFLLLILPAIIILVGVSVFPFVYCIYNSLHFYDLTKPARGTPWVGATNYSLLIQDARFWHSLKITFYFVAVGVSIELALGYVIASLLNEVKARKVLLPLFLIPMIIPPVVVGLIWRLMYDFTLGIINYLLGSVGFLPQPWLGTASLAMLSIIITDVWEWTPLMGLILLAGLQALPQEPYEAAKIDGAGMWNVLRYITLPMLKPIILVAVLLRTMDAFKWFDTIYIMTSGGPGIATETASLYSYLIAFNFFNIGKGSAFSIIMIAIVILFCTFYIRMITAKEHA